MTDDARKFKDALDVFINMCNPKAKQIFLARWVREPSQTFQKIADNLSPTTKPEVVESNEKSTLDRLVAFMRSRGLSDQLAAYMSDRRAMLPKELKPEPVLPPPAQPTGPGTIVRRFAHDGMNLTVSEWSKRTGIPTTVLHQRFNKMSVVDALTRPYSFARRSPSDLPKEPEATPSEASLAEQAQNLLKQGELLKDKFLARRQEIDKQMTKLQGERDDIDALLDTIPVQRQERVSASG